MTKPDSITTGLHYFSVQKTNRILVDTRNLMPSIRSEVIGKIPKFAGDSQGVRPYQSCEAIANRLRPYHSLLRRLSNLAFKEIDQIETALVVHDNLPLSLRARYKLRLRILTNSMHPVWENWILSLNPKQFNLIDREVSTWINEPIDWDEVDSFKYNWDDYFYGAKSAKKVLDLFEVSVLDSLGIAFYKFTLKSELKPIELYCLDSSIASANKAARNLDLQLRFRSS